MNNFWKVQDVLFVIGRNIYQAACGFSGGAIDFISDFFQRTAFVEKEKRGALLDGMLFEIFFQPNGKIRNRFKTLMFNEVFNLQRYVELSYCFDFISEQLAPYSDRFYVIPGKKNKPVHIDIISSVNEKCENVIEQICFEGANIFKIDSLFPGSISYSYISQDELEKRISDEMFIPKRLLSLSTNFKIINEELKILYPNSFTLKKEKFF
ncbi:MAG: hypothetical protein HQK79_23090 [Desulfobacterales bacterium]|nr:hypothetical protein [Desulfobacterales bacterium]